MNILVLNVGSSSLKFQLIDTDQGAIDANSDRRLARGQIERIGGEAILSLHAHRPRYLARHCGPGSPVLICTTESALSHRYF